MNINECYERLGISCTATPAQIRQAYKNLVKQWHPDRFQSDSPLKAYAEERLKIINAAFDGIRIYPETLKKRPKDQKKQTVNSSAPSAANAPVQEIFTKLSFFLVRLFCNKHYPSSRPATPFSDHPKGKSRLNQSPSKRFKGILRDLKNGGYGPTMDHSKTVAGLGALRHLRHGYGPRRRTALGAICGVAAAQKIQTIRPIAKIAAIRRIE